MDATDRRATLGVAFLAALAGLGGSLLAVGFTPRFVVSGVAAGLLFFLPDALLPVGIGTLGFLAKPALTVSAALLTLALYAGLSFAALRWADGARNERPKGAVAAAALVAVATFVLSESLLGSAGAGVAAGVTAFLGGDSVFTPGVSNARRRVLRASAAAIGVVGLGAFFRLRGGDESTSQPIDPEAQALLDVAAARAFSLADIDGLVSAAFYKVDINAADPRLSTDDWSLSVVGDAEAEREFTLADLRSLPAEHRFVTLRCVNDPVNGDIYDTALWTGVPVKTLLDEVGAPESCCVTLRGDDGYFVSFERSALDPGLLAWNMNGRPVSRGHGFPLRALVPGRWGETNCKWLTEIEIRENPGEGYWENRGWRGTGEVHTVAKLHSVSIESERVTIGGHAYAGTRGIRRVEVSLDDGETWREATLSETLPGATPVGSGRPRENDTGNQSATNGTRTTTAPAVDVDPQGEAMDAWRMWRFEYDHPGEKHEVVVRAVDGTGAVQPREEHPPFPEGSSGWVRKTVKG